MCIYTNWIYLKACLGVRFTKLGVPGSIFKSEAILLECGYDLEGDELYSVKWYKDNVEFYRFMPSYKPSAQMYSLSGVFLDVSRHFIPVMWLIFFTNCFLSWVGKGYLDASCVFLLLVKMLRRREIICNAK